MLHCLPDSYISDPIKQLNVNQIGDPGLHDTKRRPVTCQWLLLVSLILNSTVYTSTHVALLCHAFNTWTYLIRFGLHIAAYGCNGDFSFGLFNVPKLQV